MLSTVVEFGGVLRLMCAASVMWGGIKGDEIRELHNGLAVARRFYLLFERIVEQDGGSPADWGWAVKTHQSESYPMLLGLWPSQKAVVEARTRAAVDHDHGAGVTAAAPNVVLSGQYEEGDVAETSGAAHQEAGEDRGAVLDEEWAAFLREEEEDTVLGRAEGVGDRERRDPPPGAAVPSSTNETSARQDFRLAMVRDLRHPEAFRGPIPRLFDLKVYVFDLEEADIWSNRPLLCAQGMFATEVTLHRWFLHSPYRVFKPEEADFFFVPMYPSCIQTKFDKNIDDLNSWYTHFLTHPDSFAKYWFERNDGRDFIFVFSRMVRIVNMLSSTRSRHT